MIAVEPDVVLSKLYRAKQLLVKFTVPLAGIAGIDSTDFRRLLVIVRLVSVPSHTPEKTGRRFKLRLSVVSALNPVP